MPFRPSMQVSLIDFLWDNKIRLAVIVYVIFFVIYTICAAFGFLPQALQTEPLPVTIVSREVATSTAPLVRGSFTASPVAPVATSTITKNVSTVSNVKKASTASSVVTYAQGGQDPVRIVIAKIGTDVKVTNPKSIANEVLNQYLQKGAVRYPGSAGLGVGNVFLFAHSTGLRVVNNQAYKSFNNFKLLSRGDIVEVYSLDMVYVYKIDRVRLAPAEEIFVDFSTKANMITLSTCNTFGAKEERYVVEAAFVSVRPIESDGI